jgi:5-methylcytosine-specific restriction endonuclease McrA
LAEKWEYGSDNAALRSTLYGMYSRRCYRCTEVKNFVEIEIDHIVPRTTSDAEFSRIGDEYDLGENFRRHDPSNLAPICRRCNSLKSNQSFGETLHELDHLRLAVKRRQEVIQKVNKFFARDGLAQALVKATISDPDDAATRETLELFAPAFVQKIAEIDEALIEYKTIEYRDSSLGVDGLQLRSILTKQDRSVAKVLQEVFEIDLWSVVEHNLKELIDEVKEHLDSHAISELEKTNPYFPEHLDPARIVHLSLEVSGLVLNRSHEGLAVSLECALEIQQLRDVPYDRGDGTWGLQGDAYGYFQLSKDVVQSSFEFSETCELRNYVIVSTEFEVAEYAEIIANPSLGEFLPPNLE